MNPEEHCVALELAEVETKNPLGAVWHSTDPVPEENFPAGQAVAEVTPAAEDVAEDLAASSRRDISKNAGTILVFFVSYHHMSSRSIVVDIVGDYSKLIFG